MRSTSSPAICAQPIPTSSTHRTARPRRFTNRRAAGVGLRPARGQAPAYNGWDVIIVRDGKIAALYVFLDQPGE